MLADLTLPDGVALVRTTPVFTIETVPAGLLRAHQVAPGVWGRLKVEAGTVTFAQESTGESRVVAAGEAQVIEPEALHHVEPSPDARFAVEFHRSRAPVRSFPRPLADLEREAATTRL